jgi:hypothetical protein
MAPIYALQFHSIPFLPHTATCTVHADMTCLLVKHEGDEVAARDLALDDQLPAVEDDERRGDVRQHSRHDRVHAGWAVTSW